MFTLTALTVALTALALALYAKAQQPQALAPVAPTTTKPRVRRPGRVCKRCGSDLSWKRGGRALCAPCKGRVSPSLTPQGVLDDDHADNRAATSSPAPVAPAPQPEFTPAKALTPAPAPAPVRCQCGCGVALVGRQTKWASNLCRVRASRATTAPVPASPVPVVATVDHVVQLARTLRPKNHSDPWGSLVNRAMYVLQGQGYHGCHPGLYLQALNTKE